MKIAPTPTKEQANSFNESLEEEKANSSRVIALLGGLLFIIYSIIDYFGLPYESLAILYPARIINILVISVLFYLTFKPIFIKEYSKLLLFGYYCSGITITVGIYLSKPGEFSYNLYYAALMILIITSFSWSYLPIRQPTFMGVVFIAVYVIIKVFFHKATEGAEFLTLISHIFFLASVVVIAAIGQYIRDSLIYRNLQLQEDLKLVADKKTQEANKQKTLANIDSLTGIPNRRFITEQLRQSIAEAERSNTELTVVYIDLDGFKAINDNFGHDAGDKVLEVTAQRLQQTIRVSDHLARLGGDEFLLGINTSKSSDTFIKNLSENIKARVTAPIAFNGNILKVDVSLGYANYPADGKNIEELIKVSDANMYVYKQSSKIKLTSVVSTISP